MRNLKSLTAMALLFVNGLLGCSTSAKATRSADVDQWVPLSDYKAPETVQTVSAQFLKPTTVQAAEVPASTPVVVQQAEPVVVVRRLPAVIQSASVVVEAPVVPSVYVSPAVVPAPVVVPRRWFRPSFWHRPRPVVHHHAPHHNPHVRSAFYYGGRVYH